MEAFEIAVVFVWTAGELSALENGVWILSLVTILSTLVTSGPSRASRDSRCLGHAFTLGVVVFLGSVILSLLGLIESPGPVALALMFLSVLAAYALGRVDSRDRDSQ